MEAVTEPWTHHEAIVNGVRLHWVEQGSGPLVMLLHGFPEFWYSWRRQIPALATRFRVVAPDLRGYNLSEKPPRGYDMVTLTDDIFALARRLTGGRVRVVGHDWGGMLAWVFAIRFPEATEKLVVMNAPHPARFAEAVRRPRQFLRSTYALYFRLPVLPEATLGASRCWPLVRMMQRSAVRKEAFSAEDVERYREAMCQPGALRAALNYYRSARIDGLPVHRKILSPTLVLWGVHDAALGSELSEGLDRWVQHLTVKRLDCGHWTQQELPDEVNRSLLDFL